MAEERGTRVVASGSTASAGTPSAGAAERGAPSAGGARELARQALVPGRGALEEIGDVILLTGKTIRSAILPPYPYGGEFVSQFLFALRLCWLPLMRSTISIHDGAGGPETGG